ncbi:hypothetical protein RIF29_18401 [Crotalaria pallida]|uniref:Uncharacterized protein n=1 Tax=Crotalaria pallida TaxID=3830 RepID=A0AAN9FJT6_CROPI
MLIKSGIWGSITSIDKQWNQEIEQQNENEVVANMGFWDGLNWNWNLSWRRQLVEWEMPQLEELWKCMKEVSLKEGEDQPAGHSKNQVLLL